MATKEPQGSIMFGDISIVIQKVTPALAQEWLDLNYNNRNLRKNSIEQLARALRADEWPFTGDAIRFMDVRGVSRLIDGQNRLQAIIKADATEYLLVVTGLSEDARDVIDTGLVRGASDDFKMHGVTQASDAAAMVNLLLHYPDLKPPLPAHYKFSNAEKYKRYLEDEDAIQWACRVAKRVQKVVPGRAAIALVGFYAAQLTDRDEFEGFVAEILDPTRANSSGSATVLFRRWCDNAKAQKGSNSTLTREFVAVTIKAWNRWLLGEEGSHLRYRSGGTRPEGWPTLNGWTVGERDTQEGVA